MVQKKKSKRVSIKAFTITELFGDRNVQIKFRSNVKILIGENGLGKTTVLSILYYTLSGKLHKLRTFDFRSIELVFGDGDSVSIEKSKLEEIDENPAHLSMPRSLLNRIAHDLSPEDLMYLSNLIEQGRPRNFVVNELQIRTPALGHYPTVMIFDAIRFLSGDEANSYIGATKKLLSKKLGESDVLYFPTFRRIEEDLINLGYKEEAQKIEERDERLIQFGMQDVKHRLEAIKSEINNLSSRGLSEISSEILSQLVKGVPDIPRSALRQISKKDIDIILARVGEGISVEDKQKITSIVSHRKLEEIENRYLAYFLQKLVSIYDQQREIDSAIESFVSVCNGYLISSFKEIYYEASEVDFYLVSKRTNRRVRLTELLSKLSSGEKQIISLFSKIFLSKGLSFFVLFDEPELSLSIFWQKLLLPDIVASGKCEFLLSVTHSPFVFENDLATSAIGLNQYIKFLPQ